MLTREFVEDGFQLPPAKSQITWEDPDTVLLGTDFGGDSLTTSGYPRVIKRWRRGKPLADAETIFEGAGTDVRVNASADRTPGFERTLLGRALDFWNEEVYELRGSELIRIEAPTDASVSIHRDWLLIVTLADVASRVEIATPGSWRREPLSGIPAATNTVIVSADSHGDEFFLDSSGFDTPSRLMRGTDDGRLAEIKSAPAFFDAENMAVTQYFATSDDGTSIPYFVVRRTDADNPGPTLLNGYGGFETSRTPTYDGVLGRLWLARGGTYALANIRGGGEYGPGWHTQAMREGRDKVAQDFAAVATDLVTRGITTAEQLGARGGSNGGLLMGIMLTGYPEKFGALVCDVPLLDMKRYHLLLAGASWMAEYGDPDNPDDWKFISEYSPYQNISANRKYPPVLMTTSTRDDRVHPGHARKMTAALQAAGHPVWYYENIEGGHAGAADNAQIAFKSALSFAFLWRMLAG